MHIWLRNKIDAVASAPTAPTGPVFMRIFSFFWDPVTKEQAVKGRTNLCFKVSLETLQNACNWKVLFQLTLFN